MKIKFSVPFAFTFLLLTMFMMELHEIVHISIGRIICGCWGPRDFNVWELCEGCEAAQPGTAWMATLAGPLFSFILMWIGMQWLSKKDWRKEIGFCFIFSNIPFGRITTVMMGGGDEMVVIRHFLKPEGWARWEMILVGSAIVLLAGVPPLWKAYRSVHNRFGWLIILGFLTMPLAFLLFYTLMFLNGLLSNGVLKDPWILGTPGLIVLHTGVVFVLLLITRKNLLKSSEKGN